MNAMARLMGPALFVMGLAPVAPVLAHDVSAEIAALEQRVELLEAQRVAMQSQVRSLSGSATAAAGIAGAEAQIRHDQMQIAKLEGVLPVYGQSIEEMRQLARDYEDTLPWNLSDLGQKGAEEVRDKAAKAGLTALGKQGASRAVGPVSLIGDVVENGGKIVIHIIDASRLRQEAIAQHIRLNEVLGTILLFQREIAAEHVRLRELTALQRRLSENTDAQATARRRIRQLTGHAHDDANLRRVTDAEGDAALVEEGRHISVRLCDPSQKHRPVGIRPAQKEARPQSKDGGQKLPAAKETPGGFVAGAACVDIIGHWMIQQSIEVHGRSTPMGPPMRAEIVGADGDDDVDDAPPRYELYGPDRASARNGPLMRCTRTGYELACRRRVQQHACPAARYVWAPLALTVAADVRHISGNLRQTHLMDPVSDPSGCTVVDAEGRGVIDFRLVKAKP